MGVKIIPIEYHITVKPPNGVEEPTEEELRKAKNRMMIDLQFRLDCLSQGIDPSKLRRIDNEE